MSEWQDINSAILHEATFLLARLAEWENEHFTYEGENDWNGHVAPSISRLNKLIDRAYALTDPAPPHSS